MKQLRILLPAFALMLASCEKVVNIDLNNAKPQVVVEGELYAGTDTVRVHIAKTTDYYGKNPQQPITDATVTLTLPDGTQQTIPHVSNGVYQLPNFVAQVGKPYTLMVVTNGQTFTATSVVPRPAPFDSVNYIYREKDFFDEGYDVRAYITDRADEQNNYRLIYQINDTLRNEPEYLTVDDDKFNNGKTIIVQAQERFKQGDTVTYEIRTMDRPVFEYFRTLSQILNDQEGPAPANPISNLSGGALGYFGAFGRTRVGIRIKG